MGDRGVDLLETGHQTSFSFLADRHLDAEGAATMHGVADAGSFPVAAQRDDGGDAQVVDLRRERVVALVGTDRHHTAAGHQRSQHRRDHRGVVAQDKPHRSAERHAAGVDQAGDSRGDAME